MRKFLSSFTLIIFSIGLAFGQSKPGYDPLLGAVTSPPVQAGVQFWFPVSAGALAARPATCTANHDIYICNGAGCTNGNNIHYCRATDTWEAQGVAGGTGVVSLNGLNGGTQTFTDDTNVTLVSAGTAHAITWAGTLAKARGGTGNADGTADGITGGSSGQIPYQTGTGTTGFHAGLAYNTTTGLGLTVGATVGQTGGATGTYKINGTTSGTVTITGAAAAGTWSLTLPASGGTNGNSLITNGSGVTSWGTPSLATAATNVAGGSSGQVPFQTGAGATSFSSGLSYNDTTKFLGLIGGFTAGQAGTATGQYLINGTTSGTVTIKGADAAGTWSLTLPTTGGTNGYCLTTNGSGVASWSSCAGGGSGTVTVVGAGALTSTALVTGGGTTTLQTPAATATMDTSGNISTPGSVTAASFISDPTKSGGEYFQGVTSGGVAIAAADVAGTAITYVLPSTNGTTGQVLSDSGSTGCPTLPSGFPATCHLLAWVAAGAGSVTASGTPTIHQLPVWTTATDIKGIAVGATDKPLVGVTSGDPAFSKLTLTNPATSATLTVADGATLQQTGAYALNLTATAASTPTFPAGTKTLMATDTAVADSQLAAKHKTRQFGFMLGAENAASAIADADDQPDIFINQLGYGIHITQISCRTDSGTALTMNLERNDGSAANILSSSLSCSSTLASSTTFTSGEDAISDGHGINLVVVSAGGGAKRLTVIVRYTVD